MRLASAALGRPSSCRRHRRLISRRPRYFDDLFAGIRHAEASLPRVRFAEGLRQRAIFNEEERGQRPPPTRVTRLFVAVYGQRVNQVVGRRRVIPKASSCVSAFSITPGRGLSMLLAYCRAPGQHRCLRRMPHEFTRQVMVGFRALSAAFSSRRLAGAVFAHEDQQAIELSPRRSWIDVMAPPAVSSARQAMLAGRDYAVSASTRVDAVDDAKIFASRAAHA